MRGLSVLSMLSFFRNCGCRDVSEADAAARVLVVDDEPMILDAMAATLELDGFAEVTCCQSGELALAHAKRSPVDLVISDLCMPGMDGIELLAKVAELQPNAPRILLTGRADQDAVRRATEIARPFALLEKPWCNRALNAQVCRALAWSRELTKEPNEIARAARRTRDLEGAAAELLRAWT